MRTDLRDNGCAVLFSNWLRFQLRYSWQQIVSAATPTLGETYTKLSGRAVGLKLFRAPIDSRFPLGRPSGLATDNPFPI